MNKAVPGNPGLRLQAALQRAVQLLQARRWDEAEQLLQSLQHAAGGNPDLLQLLGLAAKGRGDAERAEDLFRRSLAAAPNQPAVLNNLGNLLLGQGRHREAAQAYEKAVALKPDFPDAWSNLATARARMQQHEAAVKACSRALSLSPDFMRALNRKGLSLMALERFDEAESCLRAAVRTAPDAFEPLNNLGNLLRNRGDDAAAAEVYETALRLRPGASDLKVGLAGAAYMLGRFEHAERLLRAVLAEAPAHREALRTLVSLLATTGRTETIPEVHETVLSSGAGNDTGVWQSYIERLFQLEQYSAAQETLSRARRACGDYPAFDLLEGRVLAARGQPEKAMACLSINESWPEELRKSFLVQRAQTFLRLGAFSDGAAELETAAFKDTRDYTLLTYLEVLWRLAGDERARWLLDYERFVRPIEIEVPNGYRNHDEFNRALAEVLTRLHVGSSHPEDQTLRGGTQTLGRLFWRTEPIIQALRASIEAAVRRYVADLQADENHPFLRNIGQPWRFSGSWSVRLHDQGFHVPHFHPLGWISSAYYVDLPDSVADPDSEQGKLQFGVPSVQTPNPAEPVREIQPRVGTLALFPSYCWHGTTPFRATRPRLTVAFDVAPTHLAHNQ
ncbi:MAG: tetratricopeptide repeat protein [Wenzhouxiangella sp.]